MGAMIDEDTLKSAVGTAAMGSLLRNLPNSGLRETLVFTLGYWDAWETGLNNDKNAQKF